MIYSKPDPQEAAEYYFTYINKVSGDALLELEKQLDHTPEWLEKHVKDDKLNYKYADEKWTIAEVLLHIVDCERVMAYRALRIARGDSTALPGFDQNLFAPNSNGQDRNLESIIDEYQAVRLATLALFDNLNEEQIMRLGTASDNPVSVRALAFIIAGHETHHLQVLETLYSI